MSIKLWVAGTVLVGAIAAPAQAAGPAQAGQRSAEDSAQLSDRLALQAQRLHGAADVFIPRPRLAAPGMPPRATRASKRKQR